MARAHARQQTGVLRRPGQLDWPARPCRDHADRPMVAARPADPRRNRHLMAQYDTQYTSIREPAPPRRHHWPLAGAMALDLIIILVAVLVLTTLLTVILIGIRVAGGAALPVPSAGVGQEQMLRLLGVEGIFAVLLIQNVIFVGVPVLRVAVLRREPLAEIGFQAHGWRRLVLIGIGLGIVVLIANAALGLLFNSLGVQQNQAEQYPLFQG